MLASDFSASLQYLDISIAEFASLTAENQVTVAKWVLGDSIIPRWVDALTFAWGEDATLLQVARLGLTEMNIEPEPTESVLKPALGAWQLARDADTSR